jgi:NADH-quinone oxidoreductase subunit L
MIAPLWVLAVGTIFSGVIIFYFDTLAHFILPMPFLEVAHEHHHESWLLIGLSIGIAVSGVWIGRWWGLKKIDTQSAKSPNVFAIFAENRFYLDELFYNVLVAPCLYLASVIAAFDLYVIDSFTRYIASMPETIGNRIRLWQSGPISRYAAGMVVGIIALLTIVYLRS